MIDFKVSLEESRIIRDIIKRAMNRKGSIHLTPLELDMDLCAVHCNGCPLDLEGLLQAPESDFVHDIMGIRQHLNRDTGELTGGFFPRYAKREEEVQC